MKKEIVYIIIGIILLVTISILLNVNQSIPKEEKKEVNSIKIENIEYERLSGLGQFINNCKEADKFLTTLRIYTTITNTNNAYAFCNIKLKYRGESDFITSNQNVIAEPTIQSGTIDAKRGGKVIVCCGEGFEGERNICSNIYEIPSCDKM